MHIKPIVGATLLIMSAGVIAQQDVLSFSTYAESGGPYGYKAVQSPNGTYHWQIDYEEPDSDNNLGLNFSDTFTVNGGIGAATVIVPLAISAAGSGAGNWEISGSLGASNYAFGTLGQAFYGGTYHNGIFYVQLDLTYGVPQVLELGNIISATSPEHSIAGCGIPGANNLTCTRDNEEFATLYNSAYFELPEGATLTAASGYTYPVSNVPEPSEYALMLAGLASILGFARRNRGV